MTAYLAYSSEKNNTRRIPPSQIYNADESGYTIRHQPAKILAKKAFGALTSAGRGKYNSSKVCLCHWQFCATNSDLPQGAFREELIDKAPAGTIRKASKSGWSKEDFFNEWITS